MTLVTTYDYDLHGDLVTYDYDFGGDLRLWP